MSASGEIRVDRAKGSAGRAIRALDTPAGSVLVLATAMLVASIVYLWLTRGTTFWIDELYLFAGNRGFDPKYLLTAHNGQLIWFPRLLYAAVFKLFGPDYVVIRLIELAGDLLVSGLVYVLVRRRIGPALALAPAILLLFFGSAWGSVLPGTGIINVYCVAAGLGAILSLEVGGRWADPLAAALLLISLGCWSPGIAFAFGAAVLILMQGGDRRRLWVSIAPLVLFALWWVTKPGYSGPLYGTLVAHASNVLLIPNFMAASFGDAWAAITGLNYAFAGPSTVAVGPTPDYSWGPALAVLGLLVLLLALRGRPLSRWPMHWITVLVVFLASAAIGFGPGRAPSTGRYVYVSAVLILILGAAAIRHRPRPGIVAIILATAVLALGANIEMLRQASPYLRPYASAVRADFSAVEIARGRVASNFVPTVGAISAPLLSAATNAGTYLAAVDRNGSFADTLPELRAAPETDREEADQILAQALGIGLTPTPAPAAGAGCRTVGAAFSVPPGRTLLRFDGGQPATLRLRRFASRFTASLGAMAPGRYYSLEIRADAAPDPWVARTRPPGQTTECRR